MDEDGGGYRVVRFGDRPWERRTEDGWPPLMKRLLRDPDRDISVNIIWYARGVVEPRHVHDGTHATWVLLGSAEMGGQRIGPGDLVYGPRGVPHGPLVYEMGCLLFSVLNGSTLHTAVASVQEAPHKDGIAAHLAVSEGKAWEDHAKVVLDDPARDYSARMVRRPTGSATSRHVHAASHAALIVSGQAVLDGQTLGPWDCIYAPGGIPHGGLEFPEECTLIVNTVGDPGS